MPTLEELRIEIASPLDDGSIESDEIDAKINECCRLLARKLLFPGNESSGTFDTEVGVCEVDIPTSWNFSRNLYHASVPDKDKIVCLSSVGLLTTRERYPNYDTDLEEGDIEFVTIKGSKVIYYPIPTEVTTVTCKFYQAFVKLTKDSDVPSFIPEEIQMDIIKNYVLWKIWARLEDGTEGIKVNTNYHRKEFKDFFEELDDMVDRGQSRPEPPRESQWI